MTITLERTREAWSRAAQFPADKESVYPEHAAAQEFDTHAGKLVLEYGCGGGSDALSYLRRGCEVFYVDIVPGNVEAATKRIVEAGLHQRARGIPLDESDRIPLPSGMFDVASSHGVLHHIERPGLVLEELRRLLRPNGALYVMLYTEHLWERLLGQVERFMRLYSIGRAEAFCWATDGPGTPYARAYTEGEGTSLLKAHGFRVRDTVVYNNGDFRTFRAVAP